MATEDLLSPDDLGKLIRLDAESSALYWRERDVSTIPAKLGARAVTGISRFNAEKAGRRIPQRVSSWGYLVFNIGSKQYSGHRVVFALHHGHWPKNQIDHINGIRTDNRPSNLRDATRVENARNQKKRTDNKSGYAGVRFDEAQGAWVAEIRVEGRYIKLGNHPTRDIAYQVRKAAATAYGFDPRHGTRGGRSYKKEYTESQTFHPDQTT